MKEKSNEVLLLSFAFVVVDQVIKFFLSNRLMVNQTIILIRNSLSITLTHNTGAAFSLFSGSKYFLIGIGILVFIGLIIYYNSIKDVDDLDAFIFSLLFGGIVGNLIDRIIYGYVIDYVSLTFGGYYFPIFNFADVCIVFAVVLIICRMIKDELWKY